MELELAKKILQEDQSNHSDSSSENSVVSGKSVNIDVAPRIQESSSSDDSSSSDEETEQQEKLSASTISNNQPRYDELVSEEETKQAEPTTQTFEYQQSKHVENESSSESSDDE
jgi:hypothetical protein